jgi:hypothetical protein
MNVSTPQAQLISLLSDLVPLHAMESRRDEVIGYFRDITAQSLACYPKGLGQRLSSLTSDGLPFELSVSLNPQGSGGLCYITEAGVLGAPFHDRLLQSSQVTGRVLERLGAAHMYSLHQTLFEVLFPDDIQSLASYRFGMWHGMVHRPDLPGVLKVYYNLRPWKQNIPSVLRESFSVLSPLVNAHRLQKIMASMPESAHPVDLAVEYSATGPVQVRVYHRCVEVVQKRTVDELLKKLGLAEHCTTFDDFHRLFAGSRTDYPPRSLVFYVGLDSGRKYPVMNLYFMLNQYLPGDGVARRSLSNLLARLDIDPSIYERTLQAVACHGAIPEQGFRYHTMIGIGLAHRNMKINVYLTPTWEGLARNSTSR